MNKKKFFILAILLFLLTSISAVSAADWTTGTEIAHWFDQNASDESGNARHGTVNNANLTTGSGGYIGEAYTYGGVNSYIDEGDNFNNMWSGSTTQDFTINLWFKADSTGSGQQAIYGDSDRHQIWINADGTLLIKVYGPNFDSSIGGNHRDDNWHMVTFGYDGGNWFYSINGSARTNAATGTKFNDQTDVDFGRRPPAGGPSNYFNGEIDELTIWNYSLSNDNISTIHSNYESGLQWPFTAVPAVGDNFSTVQTASYSFTTPVTISGSYGTINSQTVTSDNETSPFYFTTSMTLNSSGATTATCRIDVGGTKYATTTRSLGASTLGNIKLMTEQITLPIGDHVISTECQKTGGGPNYIVTNSDMVEVHLHDINTNQTINNQYVNGTGLSVNTTVQELASFSFTTSNISGTTNNNTVIIHGVASFTYDNDDNITAYLQLQETGEVCGNYTRYGDSGSTGSVGTMCAFKDLNSTTAYNFTFYGSTQTGTGSINNLRMHAYNLRTNTTATNNTALNKVIPAATDTEVANISITNSKGGSFTVFVDAGIMVSGAAQDAYFYLQNNEQSIKYYRTLSTDGNGNVNVQYSFDETGTDIMNYSLRAYCPSGCNISGGDLSAFVAEQDAAAPAALVVTAYDAWNNNSITSFNVTIGGATVQSNATGEATITTSGIQNITVSATGYFDATITNYNTSNDLNQSMNASIITFNATEIITNNSLTGVTFTVDGNGGRQVNGTFNLAAGNYNVTASKSGYYDRVFAFTVTALDNTTITVTDMSDTIITLTAQDITNGASITNFSGWLYYAATGTNLTFSTTSGSVNVSAAQNLTFLLYATDEGVYTSAYYNVTPDANHYNYTILMYQFNSVFITFKDYDTKAVIDDETITLELISTPFAQNYTTTNGTIYATIIDPATYTARFVGNVNYTDERFYIFTLANDTAQNLTFYMIRADVATNVTIIIYDQTPAVLPGAIVKALRYDLATNSYLVQEIKETDVSGSVIMSLTLNDEFYQFIVEYDDRVLVTTTPQYIPSSPVIINVNTGVNAFTDYFEYLTISGSISFVEGASQQLNASFTYSDSQNIGDNFCIELDKITGGTRSQVGRSCSTSSSGTITISTTYENDTMYIASGYYDDNLIASDSVEYTSIPDWGNLGLFLTFFVVIVITFLVGAFDPKLIPMGPGLALLLTKVIGMHQLGFDTAGTILLVGIIITVLLKSLSK